jgi:hypothetical protein
MAYSSFVCIVMIPRIPLNFSASLGIGMTKNDRANDPLKHGRESQASRGGVGNVHHIVKYGIVTLIYFTMPSRSHNDLNVILLNVNSI